MAEEAKSYKVKITQDQLRQFTIAQDDDNDYDESGWIAIRLSDDECYLARYGHCSCYGTFSVLAGGGYGGGAGDTLVFDWKGTFAELLSLAERKADPHLPDRTSDPEDCDHDHLMAVYEQIRALQAKAGQ